MASSNGSVNKKSSQSLAADIEPDLNAFNEQRLKECVNKHNICNFFAKRLHTLKDFKIVFILDDSGSMNEVLDESPLNNGMYKVTRWDELQEFIKISIEIANILNPSGCDVHFLNRPMVSSVTDFEVLKPAFRNKPSGFTPITKIFRKVLKSNSSQHLETNERPKKMLVVIVTDGEPTDEHNGKTDIKSFKQMLISRPTHVYTTILACTDEENSMEYLNNWDKYIKRLDVVDDFRSEKQEVRMAKGINFPFSYGDYVAKSLLGSTDPAVDNLDDDANKLKGCCLLS